MPTGYSIHFGVDYVDAKKHGGKFPLPYCSNDAAAMAMLAHEKGFEVMDLAINNEASSGRLLSLLGLAAENMQYGDILFLSFSGHGMQVRDRNKDEDDEKDEMWVLYDRLMGDDELAEAWLAFKEGARIVVVADCCHAGSSVKGSGQNKALQSDIFSADQRTRPYMSTSEKTKKNRRATNTSDSGPEIILLAASKDEQQASSVSRSGRELSLFTDELLTVYREKLFDGTYAGLIRAVNRHIPKKYHQHATLFEINPGRLLKQYPFTINP